MLSVSTQLKYTMAHRNFTWREFKEEILIFQAQIIRLKICIYFYKIDTKIEKTMTV